jgi:hypothetical protein
MFLLNLAARRMEIAAEVWSCPVPARVRPNPSIEQNIHKDSAGLMGRIVNPPFQAVRALAIRSGANEPNH